MKLCKKLLVLLPLLTGCSSTSQTVNISTKINKAEVTDTTTLLTNFKKFLQGYYQLDTTCHIPFNLGSYEFDIQATIVDKISATNHYNSYELIDIYTNGSNTFQGTLGSGEFFYAANSSGNTVEKYIDVSNTIQERLITNTSGEYVKFLGNYNSPFYNLVSKSAAEIASYVEINSTDNGYKLTFNTKGQNLLFSPFENFFNKFIIKYICPFESKSQKTEIKDIEILLDSNGNPSSMTFKRIEKDYYGAVAESYSSTFSSLESVPTLSPITSTLTADQKSAFTTVTNNLYTNAFSTGNFTQTVEIHDYTLNDDETAYVENNYTYHNYYDSTNKIMISDQTLYDSSYGETYMGVAYISSSSYSSDKEYNIIGISPSESFYSALSSDGSTYDSFVEFTPKVNEISPDFFTYSTDESSNSIYTFDISTFNYADYYFCLDIVADLFGLGDPSYYLGSFVGNSSYEFIFKTLTFTIDSSSNLSIRLDYQDIYEKDCYVITSYSDIGSTNIYTVAKTNEKINACLQTMSSSN